MNYFWSILCFVFSSSLIAQTNIKRMLAFSTISQMGFLLIGLLSGVVNNNAAGAANAYSSSMFYVVAYVLTTMASFGVIMALARNGFESEEISDFAGLNQVNPFLAAIMSICMFSLAGIPPLFGFWGKLVVFNAAVAAGLLPLAVIGIAASAIGAFYYLKVVVAMFQPAGREAVQLAFKPGQSLVLGLVLVLAVVLGLVPALITSLI